MESGYKSLFNSTDIDAESITAGSLSIEDIEIDGFVSLPGLNASEAVVTDLNKKLNTVPYSSDVVSDAIIQRDGTGRLKTVDIFSDSTINMNTVGTSDNVLFTNGTSGIKWKLGKYFNIDNTTYSTLQGTGSTTTIAIQNTARISGAVIMEGGTWNTGGYGYCGKSTNPWTEFWTLEGNVTGIFQPTTDDGGQLGDTLKKFAKIYNYDQDIYRSLKFPNLTANKLLRLGATNIVESDPNDYVTTVDIADYVTLAYLTANYWDITTIGNILATQYYTQTYLDGRFALYYFKTQVDALFLDYYTKTEIDTTLLSYYTSAQVDTLLTSYPTLTYLSTNHYTSTQVDTLLTSYPTLTYLSTNHYTKTQSDTNYYSKISSFILDPTQTYFTSDNTNFFQIRSNTLSTVRFEVSPNPANLYTRVNTNFYPYVNNTWTCGTSANRWNNIYSTSLNLNGSLTVDGGSGSVYMNRTVQTRTLNAIVGTDDIGSTTRYRNLYLSSNIDAQGTITSGGEIRCGTDGTTTDPSITFDNYQGNGLSASASTLHLIAASKEFIRLNGATNIMTPYYSIVPSTDKTLNLGALLNAFDNGYFDGLAVNTLDTYDSGDILTKCDIRPQTNGGQDLGNATYRWGEIHTNSLTTYGGITPSVDNTYSIGTGSTRYQRVYADQFYSNTTDCLRSNQASTHAGTGWGIQVNSAMRAWVGSGGNFQISGANAYKTIGTAWVATSDERLKEEIEDFTDGLAVVDQIRPRKFKHKLAEDNENCSPCKKHCGIVAQELLEVYPRAIKMGDDGYYLFDANDLTFLLINSVKELKKIIEHLTQRVTDLEAKLSSVD